MPLTLGLTADVHIVGVFRERADDALRLQTGQLPVAQGIDQLLQHGYSAGVVHNVTHIFGWHTRNDEGVVKAPLLRACHVNQLGFVPLNTGQTLAELSVDAWRCTRSQPPRAFVRPVTGSVQPASCEGKKK